LQYRLIIKQLGILILLVGGCLSTSLIWAFLDYQQPGSERVIPSFLFSMGICGLTGGFFLYAGRKVKGQLYRKEAIAVVGLGWLLTGLLGALPYLLSGVLTALYPNLFSRVCSALFESVSGFTTTGASIFPEPEKLPRAILFWRSLTHWLGGMGIIVLFVAVLGGTGAGFKYLFRSEVPCSPSETIRPRIRQTALLLWKIYIAISAVEVLCLMLQGVNLFESLCHTFGTMATGGFSVLNGSIGQYHRFGIEITIMVFMIAAGTNFNLYAEILQGRFAAVWKNRELQVYLLILLCAAGLLSLDLILNRPETYDVPQALRVSAFQAVSLMTTTGYITDDFNAWPSFSRWLLVLLMFIGGCSGSTGGGIKVIRILIFFRAALLEAERFFRPHVVRPLKIAGHTVDETFRRNVCMYVGMVLVLFLLATVLLMILHNEIQVGPAQTLDLETAFSAVVATLNNIGPGLNRVGAVHNFAFFTPAAKLLLSLLMILGRLEIMVVACLFTPNFWRKN